MDNPLSCINKKTGTFAFSLLFISVYWWTLNVTRNHQLFISWNHQYHIVNHSGNVPTTPKTFFQGMTLQPNQLMPLIIEERTFTAFSPISAKDGTSTHSNSQVLTDVFLQAIDKDIVSQFSFSSPQYRCMDIPGMSLEDPETPRRPDSRLEDYVDIFRLIKILCMFHQVME